MKDTERRVIEAAVEWAKGKVNLTLTEPEWRLRRAVLDLYEHDIDNPEVSGFKIVKVGGGPTERWFTVACDLCGKIMGPNNWPVMTAENHRTRSCQPPCSGELEGLRDLRQWVKTSLGRP